MDKNKLNNYVVVLRAPSAAIIESGKHLRVNVPLETDIANITIRTRFNDFGLNYPIPGDIWVDARGPSLPMNEAVPAFGNMAGSILDIIAFSTNAAIGNLELELAFDNSPKKSKRDFMQSMLPAERPILHVGKKVNIDNTNALMIGIRNHKEQERITRAIAQYNLALRYWRFGHEILATAHLFMGIETLVKATIRNIMESESIGEDELAKTLGIENDKLDPCERLSTVLHATIRKDVLFKGDYETHRYAKKASDAFEHGFLPFGAIRNHAVKVRDKTAYYLRKAIIELIKLNNPIKNSLLMSPYHEPLGHWPVIKYIRGQLIGDTDNLASEGQEYPILSWRSNLSSVDIDENGEYNVRFDETISEHFGEGIIFQRGSFELWKP
jgi:hypothetical protein